MKELKSVKDGETIWINAYGGPRFGVFRMAWDKSQKVLVECDGEPVIANRADCYLDGRDAYAAAAAKKQNEAMEALKLANAYSEKACGKPPSN